jgi:hypothetical protein
MKLVQTAAFVLLLAVSNGALAIEADDLPFVTSSSLPPNVMEALRTFPGSSKYALRANMNPFFVQGDFNGDRKLDTAVLVSERATGKHGIAVVHAGSRSIHVLGAGQTIDDRGDNYNWLDAWYTFPKGIVDQGIGEDDPPPVLIGDALMVIKTESASALIYWTGKQYKWYQQGD